MSDDLTVGRINFLTNEPLQVSLGGTPFNKAHLDARAAEIKRLETALTEARAEIERLRAKPPLLDAQSLPGVDVLVKTLEARANAAESELATLRDMLTLCGELGGMKPGETMADYLRRLIDEVAGKETERELAKAAAITAYLARAEKEGWVMAPREITEAMRWATWIDQSKHVGANEQEARILASRRMIDNPEQKAMDESAYRAMLAAAQNGGELPPPPRGK